MGPYHILSLHVSDWSMSNLMGDGHIDPVLTSDDPVQDKGQVTGRSAHQDNMSAIREPLENRSALFIMQR